MAENIILFDENIRKIAIFTVTKKKFLIGLKASIASGAN